MNKIWLFLMLISLLTLTFISPENITSSMISSASSALMLTVELCGVYAVWMGFLELVSASGLADMLARLLKPLIRRLYKISDPEIERLIALNMSANLLGLGGCATPMGIKAVEKMDDHSGTATPGIIMLIIVSATSIQLLPSTVIGLRAAAGSVNPADIILPTLFSTFVTTGVGIALALFCQKIWRKK